MANKYSEIQYISQKQSLYNFNRLFDMTTFIL